MLINEIFGFGRKPVPQTATPPQPAPQVEPAQPQNPLRQEWSSVEQSIAPAIQELNPNDPLRTAITTVASDLNDAFRFQEQGNQNGFVNMARQAAQNFLTKVRTAHAGTGISGSGVDQRTDYRSPAVQQAISAMVPFFQKLHKVAMR